MQRVLIWRQELERFLHTRKSPYRLVEQRSLVGIALFVYVQERHDARQIQDVQVQWSKEGPPSAVHRWPVADGHAVAGTRVGSVVLRV